MSSAEHEPTHLPEAECSLQPIGYAIGVQFHEPLKLIPQKGLEFAAKLADYVDPRGVVVKDDAWIFTQPLGDSAAGFLQAIGAQRWLHWTLNSLRVPWNGLKLDTPPF